MILQVIKLKSDLSEEELSKRAKEREPQFQAIPGLLQKYYVKTDQSGQYGGVYVWDSPEALQAYQESDLAKSIPEAYDITEVPTIEIMDILFQLRNE
ncbi:YdhR family protein [Maribacter sp. 2307UL18-2]|uniref:YdhR family protein n=1 Tax=Maribacter sp. 2307UL18-2 TaxID=3386274 RepID=UPI0039BC8CDC